MKRLLLLCALLLTGCSSFQLGGIAYCPAKHNCAFEVSVPGAASAVK